MNERSKKGELEAAQQTVKFFEEVLRASTDGILITDATQNIIVVNEAFCAFFGRRWRDVIETNLFVWLEQLDTDAPERWTELVRRVHLEGSCRDVEFRMMTKQGTRHLSVNAALLEQIAKEEASVIICIWRDITERKMAEEALRRERNNLINIFNSMEDGGYIVNQENDLEYVNPALKEAFGIPEGEKCYEYFHDREEVCPWCKNQEVFAGKTVHWEWYFIKKKKTYDLLETPLINPDGNIAKLSILRDITERKKMEEELEEYSKKLEETIEELRKSQEDLVRKEKLAILGQLAGGVAHELLNPLGVIKNTVYFLKMVLEDPESEVKETLAIQEKEVATSVRIISSLLDFARPKHIDRREVNINDVARDALSRITLPENIAVVSQLDVALPTIMADPDQLKQVFGNIILNAIQAMPEGGQLTVTSEVPSREWVAISFTDTGVGIPEENLGKLFEPLFTTKAKGIGLGLPIAKILVEAHDGTIKVQSEVGKGSTLTVRVPTGALDE